MGPSWDQTGTPSGFEAFFHFISSTTSGSASSMRLRIFASVSARHSVVFAMARVLAGHGQLALAERAAGLRVEEVELLDVEPELGLLAAPQPALGRDAGHCLLLAHLARHVGGPGVLGDLLELLGVHALALDREVGVEVRAHGLEHVDLRLERGAAVALGVADERR